MKFGLLNNFDLFAVLDFHQVITHNHLAVVGFRNSLQQVGILLVCAARVIKTASLGFTFWNTIAASSGLV
ncbi:MAG: hypothetical protein P8J68_08605 [Arenicellaceae bacterium]|nr:hypothetical protein [Arenicellaceae bacterium]